MQEMVPANQNTSDINIDTEFFKVQWQTVI